jgi:hypothetical protein
MYLTAIAWIYVVLMMSVAEATSTTGTVLGAFMTFILYGVLPLLLVLYLLGTPARWRALKMRDKAGAALPVAKDAEVAIPTAASSPPDAGGHATGTEPAASVAPMRKEP